MFASYNGQSRYQNKLFVAKSVIECKQLLETNKC